MPEPTPQLSKVTPVLVAALVCDAVAVDRSTNRRTLVGIFDSLFAAKLPVERPMSVYLKVTDAEGFYKIELRLVHLNSNKVIALAKTDAKFERRLMSMDHHIEFPPLPFPEAGRYEFQVYANDVYLGGAFLDVTLFQRV